MVVVLALASGSSEPNAISTTGRRVRESCVASAMASNEPMPDALSSAPGPWGTVSRCAPMASHGLPGWTSPRVAITFTERPASSGTPS